MPALQNVYDGKDTREKDVASDLASAMRKIEFDKYGPTFVGQVVRVSESVSKDTFTTGGLLRQSSRQTMMDVFLTTSSSLMGGSSWRSTA